MALSPSFEIFQKFISDNNIDLIESTNFVKSLDKSCDELDQKELRLRIKYFQFLINLVDDNTNLLSNPLLKNIDSEFLKNVIIRQLRLNLKDAKKCKQKREEKEDSKIVKIMIIISLLALIGYLCY